METMTTRDSCFTVGTASFKMMRVRAGAFTMSSARDGGGDAAGGATSWHSVALQPYSIGETAVTQALWQEVMGTNPSTFKGRQRPVETVSWDDCQRFVRRLRRLTGHPFRLPTEAEWEFAALSGCGSRGYSYAGSDTPDSVAWYAANSGYQTHPVGQKSPNALGLYDMCGNVWEWCEDLFGDDGSGSGGPPAAGDGRRRVIRGGSCVNDACYCRCCYRESSTPAMGYFNLGLRLALSC